MSIFWADVIAADIANAFVETGLYGAALAEQYLQDVLGSAEIVPLDEAFHSFRGRYPGTSALIARFNLIE